MPEIQKIIFVCNEEGNATFIIHDAPPDAWRTYHRYTKEQLKALGDERLSVIIFNTGESGWKEQVKLILQNCQYPRNITTIKHRERALEG